MRFVHRIVEVSSFLLQMWRAAFARLVFGVRLRFIWSKPLCDATHVVGDISKNRHVRRRWVPASHHHTDGMVFVVLRIGLGISLPAFQVWWSVLKLSTRSD